MSLKFIVGHDTRVHWRHVDERSHFSSAGTPAVSRVLPLLVVVALLVGGGFFLTRDRSPLTAAAAAQPAAAAAQPAAAATEPAAPADDAGAGTAGAAIPEGYTALEPLSEERVLRFERAEPLLEAGLDYAALIETNRGDILIDLYQDETPITVNSFVFLARHRYYDGIVFHRVLEDFMAQTGDPTGTGTGGPGYPFDDEIVPALRHDAKGTVSMANAGRGTNGSQFFITFAPTPWLDGAHTVFGRVVEGLDVLDDLRRVDPQTPAAAALLDDPVASLREAGVDIEGEGTVGEALAAALGATPTPGQSFELLGYRGVVGSIGGRPAAGFFPFPDRMERVTILTRPQAPASP
jgi:cyclophilin family peptidyl-prolyl cis-trans isomerase